MIKEIKDKISSLIQKYEREREYYRSTMYNETLLRNDFLDPLFEILGWDIKNKLGKNTSEREVLLEEPLKANASEHSKKPDYTFRLFGERKFFLEAKKPAVDISREDEPAKQVRRYGYTAGLKISVLSNFEYLYIYDTTYPVNNHDQRTKALIKSYNYTELSDKAEELLNLLGKETVYTGHFDEVWQDIEPNVIHTSIDNLFLKQINEWRLMLGQDILNAMPDIDIVELGDCVQSYINKILFLRVCEDRNIETYQRLLQIADQDNYQGLINKFHEADVRYNSGLFEEKLSKEVVCNISSSFWTIIRQLYYPESPYSFAVLSSDILGRIYEIFLAQRLALVDGMLRIVNKPENEEKDIVTTPNFIIREILRQTLEGKMQELSDEQIFDTKCADIACGSGAFLLELYQLLYDTLLDYYIKHDKSMLIQTSINTYKLKYNIKKNLLTSCIYGVDKDYNAVEACKFGLLLKLLEGEDETTLSSFHPVLPSLNNNIFYGNSLFNPSDINPEFTNVINPFDFSDLKFNYIVGNPPYMKTEDIKNITPIEHKLYPNKYTSAYKQFDKYFLFIERALSLLSPNGCLGYIVPSKFMKVAAGTKLRKLICEKKYLKALTSFGAHQIFNDKSTYTCLIILQNEEIENFEYSEVRDFQMWRVRGHDSLAVCKRDSNVITEDTWALYTDEYKTLLEDKIFANSRPLVDIVGEDYIFNGIQTSANNLYIFTPTHEDNKYFYFIGFDKIEHKVEKELTKPYFKTAKGIDALNSYRTFVPNARVIFPYKKNRNGYLELVPLQTLASRYPFLYNYLQANKAMLLKRDIQPAPRTQEEWYRYGRHQNLEACEITQKIIVGVLAQEDKYAIDTHGTLVSSGGTAGYCLVSLPIDSHYSIYYIQALLGSVQGEWMASLYGEIFRGGFIARGTKVLRQIRIRTIDFENPYDVQAHNDIVQRQKQLIKIGDKIALAAGNNRILIPLQRQFITLKEEQQNAINILYGMSKEEELLIPRIKRLYAAD